jgi:hypothetical protein
MEGLNHDRDAMRAEWESWRDVCSELKNCSAAIDINAEPRLTPAMRLWGERLVTLRLSQSPEIRVRALAEAEQQYVPTTGIVEAR